MAHLYDWYFQQTVQENELDAAFEALQTAERNMFIDAGIAATDVDSDRGGILKGLGVSSPSGLNVDVALGVAYDHQGRRVAVPTQLTVDLSKTGTTVVGAGGTPTGGVTTDPGASNKRWVSLFIVFDRALTDSRVDGLGSPVFFSRAESFRFTVAQGAAAPVPTDTAPLETGKLLLGDFRITDGGVIDLIDLDRRQVWVRGADAAVPVTRAASGYPVRGMQVDTGIRDAVLHLLGIYNDHARNDNAGADRHHGSYVTADPFTGVYGLSINVTDVQDFLNGLGNVVDTHLDGVALKHSDSDIEALTISDTPNSLSAGSVRSQMTQLLGYVNSALSATYSGGNNWADGTTNPGPVTFEAQLDKIIDDLTSAVGAGGAGKIYKPAAANWADGNTNPAANLNAFIDSVISALTSVTGGRGASKLTAAPSSTWHDASGIAAGTLHAVLNEIISDLASSVSNGGADKIGCDSYFATANYSEGFSDGSVWDVLTQLSDKLAGRANKQSANTFTAGNTFNSTVTLGGNTSLNGDIVTSISVNAGVSSRLKFFGKNATNTAGVVDSRNIPKAWVNWTGTGSTGGQTLNQSCNLSSLTMAAGGNVTATFSINMSESDYIALGVVEGFRYTVIPTTLNTNSCVFVINDIDTGSQITESGMSGKSCHLFFIGNHN